MFDRHYVVTPGDAYHRHEYHEHRAPTDESVRLLKEMEAKVEDRLIERLVLKNTVKGTVIRRVSTTGFDHEILMLFELNGEKIQTKPVAVPPDYTMDKSEWVRKLFEAVAQAVTEQLLIQHAKEVLPELQKRT